MEAVWRQCPRGILVYNSTPCLKFCFVLKPQVLLLDHTFFLMESSIKKKPLECFVMILHAGVKGRLPLGSMPPDNVHLHFLLCLSLNGLVHRGLLELIYMDVSCSHLCILNSER